MSDNNLISLVDPKESSGGITRDCEQYKLAEQELKKIRKEIKQLAANLSHMKNIAYGLVTFFDLNSEMGDTKLKVVASVDNFDSGLRTIANKAQGTINQAAQIAKEMAGLKKGSPEWEKLDGKLVGKMKDLVSEINQLHGILLIAKSKGMATADGIKPLIDAIKQVTSSFNGNTTGGEDHWGATYNMALAFAAASQGPKSGEYSSMWRSLNDGMQQTIQGVSSMSTSANTQLQFESEQYKKSIQMEQTAMQAEQSMTKSAVNNQISH